MTITTKYGDKCELLVPGTRAGAPAIVKRLSDGWQFELYYEDLGHLRPDKWTFYGIYPTDSFSPYRPWHKKAVRILRAMRAAFRWRVVL